MRSRWTAVLLFCACFGCGNDSSISSSWLSSVASDATGTKLVAVGEGIWTSTDSGTSWIQRTSSKSKGMEKQKWTAVASNHSGTHLVAVVDGFYDRPSGPSDSPDNHDGDIWTSSDSGATWTNRTSSSTAHGYAWRAVASDTTGTRLVAVTQGGGPIGNGAVWTSADSGKTWTNVSANLGPQSWMSVASDASGQNLVVAGSGVWVSTDGGSTWSDRTPFDEARQEKYGYQQHGWTSIASDATGTKLVLVATDGDQIWASPDAGVTWTATNPASSPQVWFAVASDATGTNVVAMNLFATNDKVDIWKSSDGGAVWTNLTTITAAANGAWSALALDAAGEHIIAVGEKSVWAE